MAIVSSKEKGMDIRVEYLRAAEVERMLRPYYPEDLDTEGREQAATTIGIFCEQYPIDYIVGYLDYTLSEKTPLTYSVAAYIKEIVGRGGYALIAADLELYWDREDKKGFRSQIALKKAANYLRYHLDTTEEFLGECLYTAAKLTANTEEEISVEFSRYQAAVALGVANFFLDYLVNPVVLSSPSECPALPSREEYWARVEKTGKYAEEE